MSETVMDIIAELKKHPTGTVQMRAAEEIERLRGVIFRNAEIGALTTVSDRTIIESIQSRNR